MTLRQRENRDGRVTLLQTLTTTSLSVWFLPVYHADPLCRSAVGRVEWNITGYERSTGIYHLELLICTSVLFSRQPATTVAFDSGKPQSGVSGDPQVASELNSPKIHPTQTRSWTITPLANSGLFSRVVSWMYRLSQGARKKYRCRFIPNGEPSTVLGGMARQPKAGYVECVSQYGAS